MRHISGLILAGLLAIAAPARAANAPGPIIDPDSWVEALYAHLAQNNDDPPRTVFTPRLRQAWAAEEKDAHGEVGRLDFSPFLDGQDADLKKLKVHGQPGPHPADQRIVTVDFVNGHPVKLTYYFDKTPQGWQIDEIQKVGADGWTLSVLLKYGWAP